MKEQIEVITYEQDRLNYFTDLMNKAQERYNRLFKKHKDAPYLSDEAQALSDAGRETHFLGDVVEMLEKGYRKQEWISVEDDLPNEGEDLLIWIGSSKSARIRKGITEEERQKMRNGELSNPKNVYWCLSQGDTLIERSEIYTSADVHGNNLVPYCWELDGGNTLFGQHVKYWMHQPQPPQPPKERR